MNRTKEMIFTVAAIGAAVMAVTMGAFYAISLAFPMLFYLGAPSERMAYLIGHAGLRALAWFLAFGWTTGEIPVGIALFILTREKDLEISYFAIPFWFTGIAIQYAAHMLMFSIIRGVTQSLISPQTFVFLDGLGLAFETIGVMLLCVGMLLFSFALIRRKGMENIVGWIFLVNAVAVILGGLTTLCASQGLCPPIYMFGMLLYGGLGAFLPIVSSTLLVPIFLKMR